MSDDEVQSTLACMGFFGTEMREEHEVSCLPKIMRKHLVCDGLLTTILSHPVKQESPDYTPGPLCNPRVLKPVGSCTATTCTPRSYGRAMDTLRGGNPPRFVCVPVLAGVISLCVALLLAPTGPTTLQDYVNRKGTLRFQLSQLVATSSFHGERVRVLVMGSSADLFLDELKTLGGMIGGIAGNGTVTEILFSGFTADRSGIDGNITATLDAMRSKGRDWADISASVWMAHSSICSQFLRVQGSLDDAVRGVDLLAAAASSGLLRVSIVDPVLDNALCSSGAPANDRLRAAGLAVQRYFAPAKLHMHGDGVWDLIAVLQDIEGVTLASAIRSVAGMLDVGGRACFIDSSMRRSSRAEWERVACSFGIPLYSTIPMGVRRDRMDQDWRSVFFGLLIVSTRPATYPVSAEICDALRPLGAVRARLLMSTGLWSGYPQ